MHYMTINKPQRTLLFSATIFIVAQVIFPPFIFVRTEGAILNAGYAFLFDPPLLGTSSRFFGIVDSGLLAVQLFATLIATIFGFLSLQDAKSNEQHMADLKPPTPRQPPANQTKTSDDTIFVNADDAGIIVELRGSDDSYKIDKSMLVSLLLIAHGAGWRCEANIFNGNFLKLFPGCRITALEAKSLARTLRSEAQKNGKLDPMDQSQRPIIDFMGFCERGEFKVIIE